jgi:hypothetical protein
MKILLSNFEKAAFLCLSVKGLLPFLRMYHEGNHLVKGKRGTVFLFEKALKGA